jgi:hypothetical protein
MFSLVFPSYHPSAGKPTYFVEKIKLCLAKMGYPVDTTGTDESNLLKGQENENLLRPKLHTIRRGNRWKKGDMFSPRFWSGPPYRSKPIRFAHDLRLEHVWEIMILPAGEVFIDGRQYGFYGTPEIDRLAENDGLTMQEFKHWFHHLPFEGQILCWYPDLEY